MAYNDRVIAWHALQTSHRTLADTITTQTVAAAAVMATVSLNTISAQNITDLNAAIAAVDVAVALLQTAVSTVGPALARPDTVSA